MISWLFRVWRLKLTLHLLEILQGLGSRNLGLSSSGVWVWGTGFRFILGLGPGKRAWGFWGRDLLWKADASGLR